ncbi:hypothetical protein BKA62DRAFT_780455, partial [Auriculariales sp. MPI-PUGE-AT-0066]
LSTGIKVKAALGPNATFEVKKSKTSLAKDGKAVSKRPVGTDAETSNAPNNLVVTVSTLDDDPDLQPLRMRGAKGGEEEDAQRLEEIAGRRRGTHDDDFTLPDAVFDAYGGVPDAAELRDLLERFLANVKVDPGNTTGYAPKRRFGRPQGWQKAMANLAIELMCALPKVTHAETGSSSETIEALAHASHQLRGNARYDTFWVCFLQDSNPNLDLRRRYDWLIGPGGSLVETTTEVLLEYFLRHPFGSLATNQTVDDEFKRGATFFTKHIKSWSAMTGFQVQISIISPREESSLTSYRYSTSGLAGVYRYMLGFTEEYQSKIELLFAKMNHEFAFWDARVARLGATPPGHRQHVRTPIPDRSLMLREALDEAIEARRKNEIRRGKMKARDDGQFVLDEEDGDGPAFPNDGDNVQGDPNATPGWALLRENQPVGVTRFKVHNGRRMDIHSVYFSLPKEIALQAPPMTADMIVEYESSMADAINKVFSDELAKHNAALPVRKITPGKKSALGVRLADLIEVLIETSLCLVNYPHACPLPRDAIASNTKNHKGVFAAMRNNEKDLLYTSVVVLRRVKIVKAILLTKDQRQRLLAPTNEEVHRWGAATFTRRPKKIVLLSDVIRLNRAIHSVEDMEYADGTYRFIADNYQIAGLSYEYELRQWELSPTPNRPDHKPDVAKAASKRKRETTAVAAAEVDSDERDLKRARTMALVKAKSKVSGSSTLPMPPPANPIPYVEIEEMSVAEGHLDQDETEHVSLDTVEQEDDITPAATRTSTGFIMQDERVAHAFIEAKSSPVPVDTMELDDDISLALALAPAPSSRAVIPPVQNNNLEVEEYSEEEEEEEEEENEEVQFNNDAPQQVELAAGDDDQGGSKQGSDDGNTSDGEEGSDSPPESDEDDESDGAAHLSPKRASIRHISPDWARFQEDESDDDEVVAQPDIQPDDGNEDVAQHDAEPGNSDDGMPDAINRPDLQPLVIIPLDDKTFDDGRPYGVWADCRFEVENAQRILRRAITNMRTNKNCATDVAKVLRNWEKRWPSEDDGYEQPPPAMRELFSFANTSLANDGVITHNELHGLPPSPPGSPSKSTRAKKAAAVAAAAEAEAPTLTLMPVPAAKVAKTGASTAVGTQRKLGKARR